MDPGAAAALAASGPDVPIGAFTPGAGPAPAPGADLLCEEGAAASVVSSGATNSRRGREAAAAVFGAS